MSTIVRLTGFSEALLRAWERRYRILEPQRGPGGHRLYTDDDLRVLGRIRELMNEGRSIGEIVLNGRDELLRESPPAPLAASAAAISATAELDRCRAAVVEGAVAIDKAKIDRALDQAFSAVSPDVVISAVIESAAREIGGLWIEGKCSIAGEHLASSAFVLRLHKLVESASSERPGAPKAAAACLPDERHELGALVVAYHLARSGYEVSYFGPALPFEDLERACRILAPRLVCLSVTRQSLFITYKPQLEDLLGRWRARTLFVIGGAGVPSGDDDLAKAGATLWPGPRPLRELLQSSVLQSAPGSPKVKE